MSRVIEFPSFYGELGWEICSWIPKCRAEAENYDKVICSSFKDMKPLYDFCEFKPHNVTRRSLDYPKYYRVKGKFKKYGDPLPKYDVLIHARGIERKSSYNYKKWYEVVFGLEGLRVGFIGTYEDQCISKCADERNISLDILCDYLAGAKMCIGVSSGIMHLASHCGCPIVVWGYGTKKTYYNEPLRKRYEETWNPFNSKVHYIEEDSLQPKPEVIINAVRNFV